MLDFFLNQLQFERFFMEVFNDFGEMFKKTTGRSVFNGIAQTRVQHRDSYGNNEEVYIRLSTENPKKDVTCTSKSGHSPPVNDTILHFH